jgi:hypothetical protein
VTYYPPPWDYYYMYAWIPSPFWYSGFYFPGFYVLHDFHRGIFFHNRRCVVTNHITDHRTGRVFALDPARRHAGGAPGGSPARQVRTFNSPEARNGARSILERSRERAGSRSTSPSTAIRERNGRNPAYSGSGRTNNPYRKEGNLTGFSGRNGRDARPPVVDQRMNRSPGETRSRGIGDMTFNRRDNMNRQGGSNFQRPPAGQTRSFSPPSQGGERFSLPRGGERSFSPSPQGGSRHFNSSPMGSGGFFGSPQGGDHGGGFWRGGSHF